MMRRNKDSQFVASDLTGVRFGRVTALYRTERKSNDGSYIWAMRCDCGNDFERSASRFRRATTCGCGMQLNSGQFDPTDIAGRRANDCIAIAPTELRTKGGYIVWRFRCELCGDEFERPTYAFLRGTISHKCPQWWAIHGARRKRGRTPLPDSQAHVNILYGHYSGSAARRGLEFALTKAQARSLFQGNCAYCGAEPTESYTSANLAGTYKWNGIDRLDNSLGYSVTNCVTCCPTCNWSKRTQSVDDFRNWVRRAYLHLFPQEAEGR